MKLLKTTKCKCGVQIENRHLKPGWLPIQAEKGFLGGKRVRFKAAVCDCGETYTVLMLTEGNNFKIGDLVEKPFETMPEDLANLLDVETLSRQELIALAKKFGVEGKIATMSNVLLKKAIKEKV